MGLFGPPDVQKLKARRDVKGLIKALGYKEDFRVRQAAADGLGQIGDPRAVEPLIAASMDRNWSVVRKAAVGALHAIGGARAVGALCDRLNDAELGVEVAAAEALGNMGDSRAVEPLIKALGRGFNKPQSAAAGALAQIGDPRALEPLISTLEDSHNDQEVRAAAAAALRAMHPLLVDALKHGEWSVRKRAAEALDGLGWRPNDLEEPAWYWAAKGDWGKCVAIGSPALEPLITALQDRTHAFPEAAEALGQIGDSRAIEPLVAALKCGGDGPAADALARIGDPRAVELLLPVLRGLSSEREAAAEALDGLGWRPDEGEQGAWYWAARRDWARCVAIGTPAVEPLCNALMGYSGYEPGAAEALGQIGDAHAIEPLITALTKLNNSPYSSATVACKAAAEALGKIGDARAVVPLIATLKVRALDVRQAAARALVALYRSGRLDEQTKRAVLAARETLGEAHVDKTGRSYVEGCGEPGQWSTSHTDSGAGVEALACLPRRIDP